jgi:hypothetical protein
MVQLAYRKPRPSASGLSIRRVVRPEADSGASCFHKAARESCNSPARRLPFGSALHGSERKIQLSTLGIAQPETILTIEPFGRGVFSFH